MSRLRALTMFFMNLNPSMLAIGTFLAFAFLRGNISPDQAFQVTIHSITITLGSNFNHSS